MNEFSTVAAGSWVGAIAGEYSWALWLAAPLTMVVFAALWSWWRGRARGPASMRTTMSEHDRYLAVLSRVTSARPQPRFTAYGPDEVESDGSARPHDLAS